MSGSENLWDGWERVIIELSRKEIKCDKEIKIIEWGSVMNKAMHRVRWCAYDKVT